MNAIKQRRIEVPSASVRMSEQLMTTKELAAYLGVPPRTVEAWRYKGTGPPGIRVGRHVRYRDSDVEAWLLRHTEVPSFPEPSAALKPSLIQREAANRRRNANGAGTRSCA